MRSGTQTKTHQEVDDMVNINENADMRVTNLTEKYRYIRRKRLLTDVAKNVNNFSG
jgi:hypothetical protein